MTGEQARELLAYDPLTGAFTWKADRGGGIKTGDLAGYRSASGYIKISLLGKVRTAHRLAFLIMTGEWPFDEVDHINRDRSDNRWANLRPATLGQNQTNRISVRTKHDLPRGVHPARGGRFRALIKSRGKLRHLGVFGTAEQASAAYLTEARRVHGAFLPS